MVREVYNKHSALCDFVCRVNDEDLTTEQNAIFSQLSEETRKRYYGSGIVIPEQLEGKRVLDIGCGSGSLVFILSKLVGPTGYVVGVDICDGLIEAAKSQIEYHQKAWGLKEPNCEFVIGNAEKLDFEPNSFDIIVSNGIVCLCPDKEAAFNSAYRVLKEGGQFFLSDVYSEVDPPIKYRDHETLWTLGTTGAMRWDTLAEVAGKAGFTSPYLGQVGTVNIVNEEYIKMLENGRFVCAGWRLFKLPKDVKRGASRVTYKGNITGFSDALRWDVDLYFPTGEGVEVDSDLATILSASYLNSSFDFCDIQTNPVTKRNQNPFAYLDKLQAEGRQPAFIYTIE